ncbi:hypothetical protein Tco_1055529 [Tanacetum coccineum]|uniref:Uncharacterized protein n=1 Tax=Tanacetum coccineum TaxID=301880 RepID=A0ABQ5H1X0_9ASTR
MNNKNSFSDLDQFRDILKYGLKVGNKKFEEPPLEKEILAFLASLGHSGEIRKITDVNVNKLHQPWRSFAAIINKCLSGKPSYDSLVFLMLKSCGCYVHKNEGKIPPKTKGSKKKADTDATTKQKPPTVPKEKKEKKSGKGKQKAKELETISEANLTKAEQLKILTKRSRKETHISQASGSGADEGTGITPGVPDAPDYDSDDDISWNQGTCSITLPLVFPHQDDEDSDNEVEGMDVEGAKSDEDATYVEDQGNEAVEDTNANLEGRDDVMTVTLYGQEQSSFVSSGFVPICESKQDTVVDAIFGQHAEATSSNRYSCCLPRSLVDAYEASNSTRYLWRFVHNQNDLGARCMMMIQEPSAGDRYGGQTRKKLGRGKYCQTKDVFDSTCTPGSLKRWSMMNKQMKKRYLPFMNLQPWLCNLARRQGTSSVSFLPMWRSSDKFTYDKLAALGSFTLGQKAKDKFMHLRIYKGNPIVRPTHKRRISLSRRRFNEGDFHSFGSKDIEELLLLLVTGKSVWKIFNWVLKAINKKIKPQQRAWTRQIQSEKTRSLYTILRSQSDSSIENAKTKKNSIDGIVTNYAHSSTSGTLDDLFGNALNDRASRELEWMYLPQDFVEPSWYKAKCKSYDSGTYLVIFARHRVNSHVTAMVEWYNPVEPTQTRLQGRSDTLMDFQIDFSSTISEIVTHRFTLTCVCFFEDVLLLVMRTGWSTNASIYLCVVERFNTTAGDHVKKILLGN